MISDIVLRVAARFLAAALTEPDKKVVDAFVAKQSLDGKMLTSDGKKLDKMGLGAEVVAQWVGPKIVVVSTHSAKSDESIIRYLVKSAGKKNVFFSKIPGSALTFSTGGDSLYRDQYDGWITAHVPWMDEAVGRLDWRVYDDKYDIKMVEVTPEFRRSGIATALYKKLFKDQGITVHDLGSTMKTPEGQAFREHAVLAERVAARFLREHGEFAVRVAARYKQKIKTEKGNTVYTYSERQIANRNKRKAERIEKLRKNIGKLRAKIKKDLHSQDPEKTLLALAVALMDHTYERVGNDESAKDGHVGVTGWCKKHVSFGPKSAIIRYTGKSGVKHEKKISDPAIRTALKDAYDAVEGDDDTILSWDGGRVTAQKVNDYLGKFDITAKDIRGFHANREMIDRLRAARKAGGKLPEDKKKRAKKLKDEFLAALDDAAEAVGHEPSTLRSQYLVPSLEDSYLEDGTVKDSLDGE